jgi:CBS domain-containing protein
MAPATNEVFPYKVRRRLVIAGNGECSVESSVPCSRRGRSVPLTTCIACELSDGLVEDVGARSSYLLCEVPPAELASSPSRTAEPAARSRADLTTLAEVMTSNVLCVEEDVGLEALTALLLDRGISGLPVVDADGYPVGVVSKTDVLRESRETGEWDAYDPLFASELERALGCAMHLEPGSRRTVADIMMPLAFTLYEHSSISQAAALMTIEGVHRVPVVDGGGKVVGMISSLDVMRWLAAEDGYPV